MEGKVNITSALEDYLETIYLILQDNKVARVRDIAQKSGYKPSSISQALKRLDEMGLVKYKQRDFVELTDKGEKIAEQTFIKHKLLKSFLIDVLGVSFKNAAIDACVMEHGLSDESMKKLTKFMKNYVTE